MKYKYIIVLIVSLFTANCSMDDHSSDGVNSDLDTIDCSSFTINNDENITNSVTTSIPSNTIIFSVRVETPNVGDVIEVEIIEQTPSSSAIIAGTYATVSGSKITDVPFRNGAGFLTVPGTITGKIKITIADSDCSKTVDFTITVINGQLDNLI